MHPSWRERQYQPRAAWTAIAAADPDPLYLKIELLLRRGLAFIQKREMYHDMARLAFCIWANMTADEV